jgi:3-hydroxyisobutyrate dehydrogenase-like beta-hydroxyacid dehydrogenase
LILDSARLGRPASHRGIDRSRQHGAAFAERLLDAGYRLVVSNRTPAKAEAAAALGADVASKPEELVEQVDVVLTSLANDEAFEAVATRVVAAARPGSSSST